MNSDDVREKRRADLRERVESKGICKVCRFCNKHCECPKVFLEGTSTGLCGACIGGEGYRAGYDRWGVWHGPAVPLEPPAASQPLLNGRGFRELYDAAVHVSTMCDLVTDEDWGRLRAAIVACTSR